MHTLARFVAIVCVVAISSTHAASVQPSQTLNDAIRILNQPRVDPSDYTTAMATIQRRVTLQEDSNEGSVCLSLLPPDITEGLLGLCDAWCDALQCNNGHDNDNACNLILENYTVLKKPSDPAMPCL